MTRRPGIVQRQMHAAQADENEHHAAEKRFWDKQITMARWLNGISAVAAGISAVAAVVGLFGLWFIYKNLIESQKLGVEAKRASDIAAAALVSSDRAWLDPEELAIDQPLKLSEPFTYTVYFRNTGRGPALDENWIEDHEYVNKPANLDFSRLVIDDNKTCENAFPEQGGVVTYHTDSGIKMPRYANSLGGIRRIVVSDKFVNENELAVFKGCIAYRTSDLIGKSGYCFVAYATKDSVKVAYCPKGNMAK